jgi:hypothetical protein
MKWDIKSIVYGNSEMNDFVTLRLPRRFVNDLIEDLDEHARMLKATADYLEFVIAPDDGMITDACNEHEADFQVKYYQAVLACIRSQL